MLPIHTATAIITFQLTRPSRGVTSATSELLTVPMRFQLTRPSRGVTDFVLIVVDPFKISTHTPLAGRDVIDEEAGEPEADFNSHAPRGA